MLGFTLKKKHTAKNIYTQNLILLDLDLLTNCQKKIKIKDDECEN